MAAEPGILVISGTFDERGGLQRQTGTLAAALAERAHVTVITWLTSPRPRVERRGPITIVRVPALASWNRRPPHVIAWVNTAVSALTAILAALQRRRAYTSILAIGLNPEGIVAAILGGLLRKQFVLYAWIAGPSGGSVAQLERSALAPLWLRVLSGAKAFVAQTDEAADELARLGFPQERVHVLPVGVDMQAFSPADPETRRLAKLRLGVGTAHVALYHGRFDLRHKRLDLLVSSWRGTNFSDWRLVLAGEGPDLGVVRDLARDLDPPAVFVDWQDDVRWLLHAADIAVLPTNFEGTSGTLAEAMAFGLPVLASRVPTHDRMRPDGVVLVPNERDAWTSALVTLARDPAQRAALGRLARAWVEERFDARERVAAFAALLET